jgi:PPOX class probable F420-dependent enzyme
MEISPGTQWVRVASHAKTLKSRELGPRHLSGLTPNIAHSCQQYKYFDGWPLNRQEIIRISITATRAKYANLLREPWAALHVAREDFYAYAVLEGDVSLSDVAAAPQDATVEELVELYRALQGEHADWDDYRRSMVTDQRVVVRITPTHAYGMPGA